MSIAEVAVQVFRKLESEDIRVLLAIEKAMKKHEFAPKEVIAKYAKLNLDEIDFRLRNLHKMRLIRQTQSPYLGYTLNYAGYDCLAIHTLVKANLLEAFGKPLGVGKEADVYDGLSPKGERIAVKFHRLGRISFRQTARKRGYAREHVNWLLQSKLAAEREFQALKLVFPMGVAVPEPIGQNRHAVVMGMIEGAELADLKEIPNPKRILKEILANIKKAYLKAKVIHADLSEYNIIIKPDMHILIIDWPQYIMSEHPNAKQLLMRDVRNVLQFFERKHILSAKFKGAMQYVIGEGKIASVF